MRGPDLLRAQLEISIDDLVTQQCAVRLPGWTGGGGGKLGSGKRWAKTSTGDGGRNLEAEAQIAESSVPPLGSSSQRHPGMRPRADRTFARRPRLSGSVPGPPKPRATAIASPIEYSRRMPAILKANLNRTVLLEQQGEQGIVIKRFHSPGKLRKLADGRRAAHEFRVLTELQDQGVSVPAPLELRRENEHWEVVLRWIPGAFPLDEFLSGERELPQDANDLPRRLGELLAQAWGCGLVHSDLHAGNVLLDRGGKLWLIDFQHAEIRAEVSTRRRLRDLVVLAAGVRELVSQRFRAKFLVSLLRSLKKRERAVLGAKEELSKQVEDQARLHRRHRVHRRQLRWTRESSSCRTLQDSRCEGWISTGIGIIEQTELVTLSLREFGEQSFALPNGFEIEEVEDDQGTWILIGANEDTVLREAWYTAARVHEHHLKAPAPILYIHTPEPRALFLDEQRGRILESSMAKIETSELMAILGALHDRGLALADLSNETFRSAEGKLSLGAPLEVVAATPARRARDRHAAIERVGDCDANKAPWKRAYLSSWRGSVLERGDLRRELTSG